MSLSHMERAEAFIAHYASQYYDPVKAREYYLRTRELKGRSTSGMSDDQKAGWGYVKDQLDTKKKSDLQTAAEERSAVVERIRAEIQQRREELSTKLRDALAAISQSRQDESEKISNAVKADLTALAANHVAKSADIREAAAQKIAALPPIPEGVSGERRAQLAARRAEEIAKINGDAWNDLVTLATDTRAGREKIFSDTETKRTALAESTKSQQVQLRESATASREALGAGMKAAVEKAKSDYEARKEQIKAEYEATAQSEYDGLRNNLPGAPEKGKSGSSDAKKSDKKAKNTKVLKPGTKVLSLEEAAVESNRRRREGK